MIYKQKLGRRNIFKLTDVGQRLKRLIDVERADFYKKTLEKVSPEELETTLKVMRTINKKYLIEKLSN